MTRDDIIRMARESGLEQVVSILLDGTKIVACPPLPKLERFAALVAAAEREAISDEWWACYQADMENGVKCLNERAADKFLMQYPAISEFGNWLNEREQT